MNHPAPPEVSPHVARATVGSFAEVVKARVEARLGDLAREHTTRAEQASGEVTVVVEALFDLALRGGKRVRPLLLAASHLACGGSRDAAAVVDAGAALEILQAYLLIHDDWMDGDETRRGAPSVHAALRDRYGSRSVGDACGVLAGDYGQAVAFEVLAALDAPAARVVALMAEAARILRDVVSGQVIDVRGRAATRAEVDAMHRLKTSSYTTTGPLAMGAILAGADAPTLLAFREAGDALGLAFQLGDDLLGTFGDPAKTGKPSRSDLRSGKKTALVAELATDREAERLLPRVLGVEDAPDEEVDALIARMVASGAKARVEARVAQLAARGRERIERLDLVAEGKALLLGVVEAFVGRQA